MLLPEQCCAVAGDAIELLRKSFAGLNFFRGERFGWRGFLHRKIRGEIVQVGIFKVRCYCQHLRIFATAFSEEIQLGRNELRRLPRNRWDGGIGGVA